jgi:uncharacterized protein (DUF433 family)
MEERAFWADCRAIEIDPEKLGGRPTVGVYRIAAQDVADLSEDGLTAEEVVEQFPGTPLDKVRGVLAYYHTHKPQPTPSH